MWGNVEMLANKRHSYIINLIKEKGAVSVNELSSKMGVSVETVRRDLLILEKSNALTRVHGGAVSVGEMISYHSLSARKEENVNEKIELSIIAAKLVDDGDIIYVDSGTTPVHFARAIKEKAATVITCSIEVFNELKGGRAKVILCGGEYNDEIVSFCGPLALDTLGKLCIGKAFIFPSAISIRHGICDFSLAGYPMQVEAIAKADKVYVLASSNKFEKSGLLKLCDLSPEHVYVTDSNIKKEILNAYRENGFQIICK